MLAIQNPVNNPINPDAIEHIKASISSLILMPSKAPYIVPISTMLNIMQTIILITIILILFSWYSCLPFYYAFHNYFSLTIPVVKATANIITNIK